MRRIFLHPAAILAGCLFSIVLAGLLLSSCSVDYARQAASKLESRYNESFTILEKYSPKLGSGYYEVKACPTEHPEFVFSAAIDLYDENFSDGYIATKMGHKIAALLQANLPNNCFVHANIDNPQPICHDKDIRLEEYMAFDPTPWVSIQIFAADIDAVEELVRAFRDQHQDWRPYCTIFETDPEAMKEYFLSEEKLSFNKKVELEQNGRYITIDRP